MWRWPAQGDVASRHQSIDKLQSKIQNLSDLLVQARYNQSHDLAVIAEEAAADKTPDEVVRLGVVMSVRMINLPREVA